MVFKVNRKNYIHEIKPKHTFSRPMYVQLARGMATMIGMMFDQSDNWPTSHQFVVELLLRECLLFQGV